MLSGKNYNCLDEQLSQLRLQCQKKMQLFNLVDITDSAMVKQNMRELVPNMAKNALINQPFYCSYGIHLLIGEESFINFNCTILDNAWVTIGSRCMLGPNVQIYTAAHDLDSELRAQGIEKALPVTIEDDVWIGGGAIILPGVKIGKRSVIGAGAVITKDIPADSRAVGNPAQVILQK
ncbi:sugar O-acetyltransferase [Pelagibaculum spongiae]|nr:sugar O-acetyltransferase [Pelagibaculum spongiae]